jgi:hypothetical protein
MDERGFGAILEDINDKFSVMIEGLSTVNQKFDTFKVEITERIDSLEKTMRSNFKTVFDYLSRMDEDIQQIKSDLANLKVSKAEEAEVAQMKIRIKNLEYELAEVRRIAERKA